MSTAKLAYDIEEACEIVGLGRTKLYEAIAKGELKARKVGTRTIILRDEFKDYLQKLPLVKGD